MKKLLFNIYVNLHEIDTQVNKLELEPLSSVTKALGYIALKIWGVQLLWSWEIPSRPVPGTFWALHRCQLN